MAAGAAAQTAEAGRLLYVSKTCNTCHNTPPTLTGNINRFGANNPQAILDAIAGNVPTMAGLVVSSAEATSLALFMAQKEIPAFNVADGDDALKMRLRAGVSFDKNVYPLLNQGNAGAASDGTITAPVAFPLVGLTVTNPANALSSGASSSATIIPGALAAMNYRARYTSGGSAFAGSDGFTVSVANQSGTVAARAIDVTVYGITSAATAANVRQQDTGPATTLYTITSNDPLATFSVTVDRTAAPALNNVSLASLGLSLGARTCGASSCSQPIVGTFTGFPADYVLNVTAAISGVTAVESGGGNVSKSVALKVLGITSSATATFAQDTPISSVYQITSFPAATASFYSVSASTPAGLTLGVVAGTGQITGTPLISGSFTVTVGARTGTPSSTDVTQQVAVTVTSAGLPTVGTTLPAAPSVAGTLNASVNASNYFVTLTRPSLTGMVFGATGLPTGLSVNASGQIIGAPLQSGDFLLSLTGSNATGAGTPLPHTIRINPIAVPVISGAASISINANQPMATYTITSTNKPILNYSVSSGTLPTGLVLNADGTITGSTATSGGPFNVTLRATNVVGNSNDLALAITVVPTSLPTVTVPQLQAAPLITGTVGAPIVGVQINATNPIITAWGAAGLPAGLGVDGNGLINGIPTQSGDFVVSANATNNFGTGTVVAPTTIRIAPNAVPSITSAASASGTINSGFNYSITATNPVFSGFAFSPGGSLPPGLNLVVTPTGASGSSTAAITGTPSASGLFSTSLTATNSFGTSAAFPLSINILPTSKPVVSATFPVPAGTVGQVLSAIQINATNPAITAYGATGLPTGLSVNAQGQVVGTPLQSGTFAVTLSATNAAGQEFSAPMSLVINPNALPAINSANTVTGTVGAPIVDYQITATNNPLTAYAVKLNSALPGALVLNTSTGLISGTPGTSGTFSTIITATNVVGTSADFTLSFNFAPNTAPQITSPTFASFPAGTAISPLQVVATNLPILSYAATNLPVGLGIDPVSGLITGTPTTPGMVSATITATNAVGPTSRVVPFTIGVPAPNVCALSVPVNTSATLNLASCLFAGFNPTGVTVISTPSHGTAQASGTSVTYTPVRNYFGTDSFTFVGTGLGGISPQGTVSVTVTGRPDPTQDPTVAALVAAQMETAQRFSRAQISNFQRRMEALHRPPGDTGPGAGSLQQGTLPSVGASTLAAGSTFAGAVAAGAAGAPAPGSASFGSVVAPPAAEAAGKPFSPVQNAAALGAAAAQPRTIGAEIVSPGANAAYSGLPSGAREVREAEALNLLASGSGLKSLPFSESVISLIKSRSVDLASAGAAIGLNTTADRIGKTNYWMEGVASFGTRDAANGIAGSEFSSNGISIGMDRRLSDDFAWGIGLGYARDKALIGTDGSVNKSKGYSLAVYGSYQPSPNTFLDGLLGVGSLDFSTRRFVPPANDFALGNRNGTQVFGSLTGGYEMRDKNLLVSPYGRLDFSVDKLDRSTETGAGAFALTYFSQTSTSIQGALGVRAESAHATSFGYAIPRIRAELRHEFKGTGQAFIGYADQPGGPRFGIASAGNGRDSVVLGLGSDFLLRDGLTLSLEYQLSHSFASSSGYALRLRLSKDFDVKGMPKLKLAEAEPGEDHDWQFDAGVTRDDNVTRAKSGPDRLHDEFYGFNIGRTFQKRLTEQTRLLYTGTLGGQKFHRYNGLSNLQASLEAEYQYRESSEFDEPTYAGFGKITAEEFESGLRDGYRLSVGGTLRFQLTDRIGVFAALSHNRREARSAVFNTRDNAVRGNLDYALSERETVYLGSELRVGDIVSTGRASLENVSIARMFAQDDVFGAGQMFSYRVDGRTWLTTIGYNLSFGPRDSIDFSWRHVRSTPGIRPAFVTGPRSYKANQLSAVYLLRF